MLASVASDGERTGQPRLEKDRSFFICSPSASAASFDVLVLHAGKMDAGNLLYVTGSMWSPALAAFATKDTFWRKRARFFPGGGARHVTCGSAI